MGQAGAFNNERFVQEQLDQIRVLIGGEKAVIAVSGGVDSTTCAVLTKTALGASLKSFLVDTGFMRKGEVEDVQKSLSNEPYGLDVKVLRASQRMLSALKSVEDAEEKRKAFRDCFYSTLAEASEKHRARFLFQGTIAPDWIETVGGIKSQHNVLEQSGIDPKEKYGFTIVEPLSTLYKDQVRSVARYLELPLETAERQPFPGPGLLVRCIGKVERTKLSLLKEVTEIVESQLSSQGCQQYFAGAIDNDYLDEPSSKEAGKLLGEQLGIPARDTEMLVFRTKVTGVKGDERAYGNLAAVWVSPKRRESLGWLPGKLDLIQQTLITRLSSLTRVAFGVKEKKARGKYSVIIRAVQTRDFMTAEAAPIPWNTLSAIATKVLNLNFPCTSVYYDITPKPPATIEFE